MVRLMLCRRVLRTALLLTCAGGVTAAARPYSYTAPSITSLCPTG